MKLIDYVKKSEHHPEIGFYHCYLNDNKEIMKKEISAYLSPSLPENSLVEEVIKSYNSKLVGGYRVKKRRDGSSYLERVTTFYKLDEKGRNSHMEDFIKKYLYGCIRIPKHEGDHP